jgi:hypothetical protein
LHYRLRGRPIKENQDNGELRRDQRIGQPPGFETGALLHLRWKVGKALAFELAEGFREATAARQDERRRATLILAS